jgi:DNA-binding MarR family transcriptional regulator
VLTASRALMGVAVRSLAAVEGDVTLAQYRALVLLVARGDQNVSDLADALGIHASTATRLCDRLVAKGYMGRVTSADSRRETTLSATTRGRAVVRTVSNRRRREVTRIVEQMSRDERHRLQDAFDAFAAAATEAAFPEDAWKLGWTD